MSVDSRQRVSTECHVVASVPVLGDGLLPLEGVLSPNSLGVDELTLPRLDVTVQVRNQLVLFVAHSRPEVGDSHVRLLGPPDEPWGSNLIHKLPKVL